jgi:plastocyanin
MQPTARISAVVIGLVTLAACHPRKRPYFTGAATPEARSVRALGMVVLPTVTVLATSAHGHATPAAAATHEATPPKRQERDANERTGREAGSLPANEVGVDNFSFSPQVLTVKRGTEVTWINKDDVPHLIVNVQQRFKASPVLDTDQRYSVRLDVPGTYDYFCSLHPKMVGKLVVQ